jgi:outer membrane protein assembly factor BamB
VVWGNRVFLTTVTSDGPVEEPRMGLYFPYGSPSSGGMPTKDGDLRQREKDVHHWLVYAIDFDSGAVVWKTEVNAEAPKFDRHLKNTYASETPVTDGERVYAYFGNVGVFAIDMNGKKVWERRFEPKATRLGWGTAASPVLADGKLFIVNDNDEQSFLVALDAASGRELWKVDRDPGTNWATPFVWRNDLRTELVDAGCRELLDGILEAAFGGRDVIVEDEIADQPHRRSQGLDVLHRCRHDFR